MCVQSLTAHAPCQYYLLFRSTPSSQLKRFAMTVDNFQRGRKLFGSYSSLFMCELVERIQAISSLMGAPPADIVTLLGKAYDLISLLLACDPDCLGEAGAGIAQLDALRDSIEKWALVEAKGSFLDVGVLLLT